MTEESNIQFDYDITWDDVKKYKQFYPVPAPSELAELAGRAIIQWSAYESHFLSLLEAMVQHNGTSDSWRTLQKYRKLATRLQDELRIFAAKAPVVSAYLIDLVEQTREAQIKRNALAHGSILLRQGGGKPAQLLIEAKRNGKPYSLLMDRTALRELYLQLASYTSLILGPLESATQLGLTPASDEKQAIQDFLDSSRQTLPTDFWQLIPPQS